MHLIEAALKYLNLNTHKFVNMISWLYDSLAVGESQNTSLR